MVKSITVQVTCVAGAEVLADVMNGLAEKKRTLKRIYFEQGVDLRLRVYINQERVVDAAVECNQFDYMPVELNRELDSGDSVKAGMQSDGAATTAHYITVEFEEN